VVRVVGDVGGAGGGDGGPEGVVAGREEGHGRRGSGAAR
jgi:hypothetical protein